MKTKLFFSGVACGIFFFLVLAFQSRKKEMEIRASEKVLTKISIKTDTAPRTESVIDTMAIDSLLPDSTRAKLRKAHELGKKLDKITDKSASKLVIEEKQTKELEKQDSKLGRLVQSAPFVQPIQANEIPAKNLSYPDTLKITTSPEKKSFIQKMNPFRRKSKSTNGNN